MANTLLLDIQTWDLTVDSFGNIAVASEPYALAQDAASQCRLFLGELWYDTTQGIPYFQEILGQMPPLAYLRSQYEIAASLVPDVTTATIFIASITQDRILTGQVQITSPQTATAGAQAVANFSSFLLTVGPSA